MLFDTLVGCIEGLNQFFQSKEGETHIVSAGRGLGGGAERVMRNFWGKRKRERKYKAKNDVNVNNVMPKSSHREKKNTFKDLQ